MSEAIATCPLDDENEAENGIILTSTFLQITKKGKARKYTLTAHMRLEVNHRQLLGPVVGGGLLSCFSLITLFTVNNWALLLLTTAIAGMAFVYYGFVGVDVLTLREYKIHYDITLTKIPAALPAFVSFYNSLIPRLTNELTPVFAVYYLPSDDFDAAVKGHLYIDRPVSRGHERSLAVIDLLKLPFTVKFTYDGINHYSAPVGSPISEEAYLSPYEK